MLLNKFKNKFLLTIACLLSALLVLSVLIYWSAVRIQFLEQRTSLAQHVLSQYISVSNYAYRKLNAMGEIVSSGILLDEEARNENEERLLKALAEVRKSIELEISFAKGEPEHEEIYHFAEIERIAKQIIQDSHLIKQAMSKNDSKSAKETLKHLRSDEVAGRLNKLLDEAIEEEEEETIETEQKLNRLISLVKTVIPIALVIILTPTLYFVMIISRRLTKSISILDNAAKAYTTGDLTHQTLITGDEEFVNLSDTFNTMAQELLSRRNAMEESHHSLEHEVSERTKDLGKLNQRLEKLDQSRRQFLADISHELRSPLTVIQGEAEVALRGGDKSAIEYQQTLERVRQQTLHTAHLVDDLLFIARSEDGKARIKKRNVLLNKLLESVCFDFKTIIDRKEINLVIDNCETSVNMQGDMDRLRQVFTILIDNAIRYSHPGGKIEVSLVLNLDQNQAIISIADEGIGMTEEDINQAFYRFYRGANAERHSDGTGLGLPVAKAIVEAHYGEISLKSKPAKGVEAIVQLPVESKLSEVA